MTVPLLQLPRPLTVDANGTPRAGAKLYTYAAGTNNPVPVYQDSLLTILHASPVLANTDGVFPPIYADPSLGDLKINLTTAADIQVAGYPVDNIPTKLSAGAVTLSSSDIGAVLYPPDDILETSIGVVPTNPLHPIGDLRRYGAVGGLAGTIPTADDSTAWQSAVQVGRVIIPAGMAFKVVTGFARSGPIRIEGAGPRSQIYNDSAQGTTPLLTLTNGDGSYLHDFYVGTITAPLTMIRYVPHSLSTTAATTISVNTIVVANATGIAIGMQCFGDNTKVWNGAIVTAVAGTTITLSHAALASAAAVPVRFQSISFNIATPYPVTDGVDPFTTIAQSTAAGRSSPTVNDLDVWPRLSGAQQNLAQIGAVLNLGGNGMMVERLYGQGLSINCQGASNTEVSHCILRGGWSGAGIMFFNTNAVGRISNNRAIGNMVSDHAFEGIAFMGCDGCTMIGNTSIGMGEAGFKTFVNSVVGSDPCTGITSMGNQATACFQLGFDFTQQYPTNGSMSMPSVSMGDRASWCPLGGFNMNGSGWNISGLVAELNQGPALYAVVSDSIVSGICRENCFHNINGGVLNNVTVNGTNNTVSVRVYNETTRNAQYQMAVSSTRPDGIFGEAYSTSLVNCDLRDLVTPAGNCLILGGGVTHLQNVRTNGTYDTPMHSPAAVVLTYSASMTPDLALGNTFLITATNTTAFTINAPLSRAGNGNAAPGGQRITIRILATAALGVATWNAAYKMAAWTQPANGLNRSITFEHNGSGTWYEISRTTVDVPN